ncbi:MAG: lasso RiPP family leader peptide-containing protein [Nitrospiraceae bacterium]
MTDRTDTESETTKAKQPYRAPELIEYGPVEKLTQTGSFDIGDVTMMRMVAPCL